MYRKIKLSSVSIQKGYKKFFFPATYFSAWCVMDINRFCKDLLQYVSDFLYNKEIIQIHQ